MPRNPRRRSRRTMACAWSSAGRLGTPEEMAWMVAYLASPAGDFLSGCVITVDGARDNWFGAWPPPGAATASGEPLAEERRKRDSQDQ